MQDQHQGRPKGFYFVRERPDAIGDGWMVCAWTGDGWLAPGNSEKFSPDFFPEIDEHKILRQR